MSFDIVHQTAENSGYGKVAESRADFAHKLSIALKEANETIYWLDMLNESYFDNKSDTILVLRSKGAELLAMLISSVKTTKASK